jgi:PhnB protein
LDPEQNHIFTQSNKTRSTNSWRAGNMKLDIYVNYPGHCKEAFEFYEQHLGGKITIMMTHEQQPGASVPVDWNKAILHARIQIGNTTIMGADIPNAEPMRSAYLTLRVETNEEAEKIYALLSDGGHIFMKLQETFFASRFAMLRDRFGTSWMLLRENDL